MKRVLTLFLSAVLLFQDIGWTAPKPPPAVPVPPAAPAVAGSRAPMIQVSVDSLEISDSNTNNLGVLWGENGGPSSNGTQNPPNTGVLNFLETSAQAPTLLKAGTLSRQLIGAKLEALIQTNQARVLANPTLLTKSGFEANFLVGGEIPYPTIGQGGAQGVEYKKYGVALKILPLVTPSGTIDAQINVGVSSPDKSVAITLNGLSVPGLASRETGTKVEVKDGETVVISGIKQSTRSKVVTKVPILGYIPILGLLFRSTEEVTTQTSLVLFVTFKLIK